MRIGFHVEDESDKTLLKAFIRRITGMGVNEPPTMSDGVDDVLTGRRAFSGGPLKLTGCSYVFDNIEAACRDFHARYFRGIVITIDNDAIIPRHEIAHAQDTRKFADEGCRFCKICRCVPTSFSNRTPAVDPFSVVVSVPVEMIEAWILFGKGFPCPEDIPKSELKLKLYSTMNPSRSTIESTGLPIIDKMVIDQLEQASPSFHVFADQIRNFVQAHGVHLQQSPYLNCLNTASADSQ